MFDILDEDAVIMMSDEAHFLSDGTNYLQVLCAGEPTTVTSKTSPQL
jgi:hypothetical protein